MDRATVQWLRAALSEEDSVVVDEGLGALITVSPAQARAKLANFVEGELDHFLSYSEPYPVEHGHQHTESE